MIDPAVIKNMRVSSSLCARTRSKVLGKNTIKSVATRQKGTEPMTFKELQDLVNQWAEDKGIFANATPLSQFSKTQEEVDELADAIVFELPEDVEDAIGDIMVTLIIQAKMWDLDAEDCLAAAYNVISKRTGKMEGGVFVKDE